MVGCDIDGRYELKLYVRAADIVECQTCFILGLKIDQRLEAKI